MSETINFRHILERDGEEIGASCRVEVWWDDGEPGSASYPLGYYAEIQFVRDHRNKDIPVNEAEQEEIKDIAVGIYKGE